MNGVWRFGEIVVRVWKLGSTHPHQEFLRLTCRGYRGTANDLQLPLSCQMENCPDQLLFKEAMCSL